jgi:hypothetical protein
LQETRALHDIPPKLAAISGCSPRYPDPRHNIPFSPRYPIFASTLSPNPHAVVPSNAKTPTFDSRGPDVLPIIGRRLSAMRLEELESPTF